MAPVFGLRAAPLDTAALDRQTVSELERVLTERVDVVSVFGSCPCCHEAEARAFLAKLRRILDGAREP